MKIVIPFETSPVKPEHSKTLLISAGHSDKDPGAVSYHNNERWSEADIVTEFRDLVCGYLNALGIDFIRDGEFRSNLPLSNAITLASTVDVAIEFHCNAFSDSRATGAEVLSGPTNIELSNKIVDCLSTTMQLKSRGVKGESSGQHSRLGFISKGNGIIVELFFISNYQDLLKYQTHKEEAASALAQLFHDEVSKCLT